MRQEMIWWQWHQLDHVQVIYTSLQTHNHPSTLSLNFLQAGCSSWRPTNIVKALKAERLGIDYIITVVQRHKLKWYGQVLRKDQINPVKRGMDYEVGGVRLSSRPRKTWEWGYRKRLSDL